ncbi:MAG TPA: MotA/TolQ/ExbB proton channel family protein [Burkholderiales bacterium]|nr:MotA/TolQ/ExbB proton channel family protein [Burkholderiales bacterium]
MQALGVALSAIKAGGVMVYPIAGLALIASCVIADKAFVYWRYVRLPQALVELIETYDFAWAELQKGLEELAPRNYFRRFFIVIGANRQKPIWWVESRASDEAQQIEQALARGLWILETTVTAAPLLGLLGTIVGMMQSFGLIGASGLVDPTAVTAGVAEALIATALGLAVALLALFAFNYFSHLQAQRHDEMERLGTRLVDRIRMDQTKEGRAREVA